MSNSGNKIAVLPRLFVTLTSNLTKYLVFHVDLSSLPILSEFQGLLFKLDVGVKEYFKDLMDNLG